MDCGGPHTRGPGPVLGAVRDGAEHAQGARRRNHLPAGRSVDEEHGEVPHRSLRRVPAGQALHDSRPRPAVHQGFPGHPAWQRRGTTTVASAESEPQCLRRTVRTVDQVGVSGQGRTARRTPPSARDQGVRRPLPRRAPPPGPREFDHHAGRAQARRWAPSTSPARSPGGDP